MIEKKGGIMKKFYSVLGVSLMLLLMNSISYAEINTSPSEGKLILNGMESTTLNAENSVSTIVDSATGGNLVVNFEPGTNKVAMKSSLGNVSVTYNIAKIFLNEGESVEVNPSNSFKSFTISNTSQSTENQDNNVTVTFPDGSYIVMPSASVVSLVMLADGSYHLKVISGTVEYTDAKGYKQTLTVDTPPILIQGFTDIPNWRTGEIERNAATP